MANKYNITAKETWPKTYCHLNGTPEQILDRFAVSEICRSWPVYRDASEWSNYRSAWVDKGGFLWTTWGGAVDIDEFIKISKEGRANGDMIMHRENGTLVELNSANAHAVGKMKATITQRFFFSDSACDVECDCRFIFFCKKIPDPSGKNPAEWKVQYVKLFYEKDKVIPLDGQPITAFKQADLDRYPEGYKYLGVAQERLGTNHMLYDLPNMMNKGFYELYDAMGAWMEGKDAEAAKLMHVPGY